MYKNRYPNGNSVAGAVGLTTGVGAGSPPYTPLPGAASPDQTTTTPLCHPISSNEGSYNLHHKSKGNTFSFSIIAIHLLPRHSILIEIRSFLNLQTSFEISKKKLRLFFKKSGLILKLISLSAKRTNEDINIDRMAAIISITKNPSRYRKRGIVTLLLAACRACTRDPKAIPYRSNKEVSSSVWIYIFFSKQGERALSSPAIRVISSSSTTSWKYRHKERQKANPFVLFFFI